MGGRIHVTMEHRIPWSLECCPATCYPRKVIPKTLRMSSLKYSAVHRVFGRLDITILYIWISAGVVKTDIKELDCATELLVLTNCTYLTE